MPTVRHIRSLLPIGANSRANMRTGPSQAASVITCPRKPRRPSPRPSSTWMGEVSDQAGFPKSNSGSRLGIPARQRSHADPSLRHGCAWGRGGWSTARDYRRGFRKPVPAGRDPPWGSGHHRAEIMRDGRTLRLHSWWQCRASRWPKLLRGKRGQSIGEVCALDSRTQSPVTAENRIFTSATISSFAGMITTWRLLVEWYRFNMVSPSLFSDTASVATAELTLELSWFSPALRQRRAVAFARSQRALEMAQAPTRHFL